MGLLDSYVFKGNERFEVQGHLGSGTSGDVFRVFDRKRQAVVALKTLHKSDPSAVMRFKTEFRALTDVNHPNLVQLYELLADGDRWYFTMELVEGLDFIDYVRAQPAVGAYETARFYSIPTPVGPPEPARLRMALRQLAEGLFALHRAGKLHCDIKPSNIRVTPDGRVVLLDFGLVKELYAGPAVYETMEGDITGTPAYMSPEQAAGREMTEASDWYSVGVVLYEALTGRIPFRGGFLRILTDKQRSDPEPPTAVAKEVPGDLSELTMRLMARSVDERLTGVKALRGLGAEPPAPFDRMATSTHSSSTSAPFVGRHQQLNVLLDAFESTRTGRTAVVFVHGSSGMGKSALVRHFVRQLSQAHDEAVLLTGRCYERESVPYKALDALIDALTRYLRKLEERQVEVLLPTNVLALARLFPSLRRVPAVSGSERRVLEIPDSREQRRRAFGALRELLGRLAARVPLILWIDDLQWGDRDSAALLSELLRPPDAPPLLLITCYRAEERETSPLLASLLAERFDDGGASTLVREVDLQELTPPEAEHLALALLGEESPVGRSLAKAIGAESGGSPFFIDELVRWAKAEAGLDQAGERTLSAEVERAVRQRMTLDNLIQGRLDRLPSEARRLLTAVAVAGRPVDLEAVRSAAELGSEVQAAIAALRGASLVRMRSLRDREEIEPYHDRIRETVVRGLEAEALAHVHRRLARALEATRHADPETLATHYLAAGERQRAAELAVTAGDQAAEALAFDRAARLYRIALDLEAHERDARREIEVKLGNALVNAGRGAEAAPVYLAAAEGARAGDALEWRRRAAEQWLISGHIDGGIETVNTVLSLVGMELPPTPRRTIFALAGLLIRLKLRGIDFEERDATQIAAEELIRIDTCWSVAIGLGLVDTIRGMVFGKRNLLLALEAGEPYRVARALAIEAAYTSTGGTKTAGRTEQLVRASMALAERVGHPHALGLANMTAGMAAYLGGQWKKACELLERAEAILRERCTGVTWEIDTAMSFQMRSLLLIGDLAEIKKRLPRFLKDVADKGDLYAETNLRSRASWMAMLIEDHHEDALAEVSAALEGWSQEGFHLQHYWRMTGIIEIALYRGDAVAAWAQIEEDWPKMERSLFLRIQFTRHEAYFLRGRAALAAAVIADDAKERDERLSVVDEEIKRLKKEKLFWAEPLALLLTAGALTVRGKDGATAVLADAASGLAAADMELYATVARRRRGQLLGDGQGHRLIRESDEWMVNHGVVVPERMADVVAPGVWSSPDGSPARRDDGPRLQRGNARNL
ncbi:MAG: AAA family ATPase [Acidobacteriota bacterium]